MTEEETGATRTGAREVARTNPRGLRSNAVLPLLFALQAVLWTVNAVRWLSDPDRTDGWFAVLLLVLLVAAAVGTAVSQRRGRTRVLLTEDALVVERRRHPVTVTREDVQGVRGDIQGRPRWSSEVLVEHSAGTVRLTDLEPGPGELIPLLQEWAGVGEAPDSDTQGQVSPT